MTLTTNQTSTSANLTLNPEGFLATVSHPRRSQTVLFFRSGLLSELGLVDQTVEPEDQSPSLFAGVADAQFNGHLITLLHYLASGDSIEPADVDWPHEWQNEVAVHVFDCFQGSVKAKWTETLKLLLGQGSSAQDPANQQPAAQPLAPSIELRITDCGTVASVPLPNGPRCLLLFNSNMLRGLTSELMVSGAGFNAHLMAVLEKLAVDGDANPENVDWSHEWKNEIAIHIVCCFQGFVDDGMYQTLKAFFDAP